MFRQKTGSVVCASCGSLVGVNDPTCYTCGRRNPGLWGFGPVLRRFGNDFGFTTVIVYGCGILYGLSLLLTVISGGNLLGGSLFSAFGPNDFAMAALGVSGGVPVFHEGHWWTLLTAGWLHGGALHIFFNVMWVRQLGPAVDDLYGGARMVIIYTLSSVSGFLLSSVLATYLAIPFFSNGHYTLGASAPIFGLLGAMVHYGRRGGSSLVGSTALNYALTMGVFGLIMPGIDNAAHLGGFLGGFLVSKWLDPLKHERMDHFIGAALCLVATALAIVVSLFLTLPYLRYFLGAR